MGLWDSIQQAIFGKKADGVVPGAAAPAETTASAGGTAAAPAGATAAAPAPAAAPATPAAATASSAAAASAGSSAANVDVTALLDAAVAKSGQKLDWRKSIVDLLKALGLDSSLSARKELATELGYTGDQSDSAAMNIWLHKQVIQKLKDNGGVVPAELL